MTTKTELDSLRKANDKQAERAMALRKHAEALVDAIGEALDVDTGTIHESRFEAAIAAALKVIGEHK